MSERPIPFSAPMVRAILDGRKTMTRRVVRPDWWRCLDPEDRDDRAQALTMCPHGAVGDRLWVRETWCKTDWGYEYRADVTPAGEEARKAYGYRWKSPRFMPRVASRITLEIAGLRVERLQDVTGHPWLDPLGLSILLGGFIDVRTAESGIISSFRDGLEMAWGDLYGFPGQTSAKAGKLWADNPWVWAITFRRVTP